MSTLSRSLALALFAPAAAIAQVDTSDWECEYCPFEDGYRADVDVGAIYVNDDAARFGNGTGLDEKGTYVDLSGNGSYAKDGVQMRWYAEDLGLSSRVLHVEGGRQGHYVGSLTYRELPYRRFDTSRTVFSGGGNDLSLPSGWVRAPNTSGMTALGASLTGRTIETDRQSLELAGDYRISSEVALFADYGRQRRDGFKITTGSTFGQASFLPAPIDDYTDRIDLGASYSSGGFNVRLAYLGSFYRNELTSLTWDNPFVAFTGQDQGRTAVAPDNDFQQFSLSGGYFAETMSTTLAFSLAMGQGEQTAALLPYTINATLAPEPHPVAALNGKVDTTNYAFTVTSRPIEKARIRLSYRYDERDNKTPIDAWSRVITDALSTVENRNNVPYSFERSRFSLSGSYRLFPSLRLSAGYDRAQVDRDFQEVAEQTEDTGWGKVRWRASDNVEISARGGTSRRDIDRYDETLAVALGQNPLMRKYYLAYRYREFADLSVALSLAETPLSIGVTWLYADDSYTGSELGMTSGKEDRFTADLSYAVGDTASLYVSGGGEVIEARQLGSETFAAADWQADHEDTFRHYGGGLRILDVGGKADVVLDYTRSLGETDIEIDRFGGSTSMLPTLESVMDSLSLNVGFSVSDSWDANVEIRYEHMDVDDWALDGVGPATIPTVLTMGAGAWDYDVWAVGIGFSYRLGESGEQQ